MSEPDRCALNELDDESTSDQLIEENKDRKPNQIGMSHTGTRDTVARDVSVIIIDEVLAAPIRDLFSDCSDVGQRTL